MLRIAVHVSRNDTDADSKSFVELVERLNTAAEKPSNIDVLTEAAWDGLDADEQKEFGEFADKIQRARLTTMNLSIVS
jgi:predicted CopG family antitoxin